MKKIVLIVAVVSLSSCGIFKRVQRQKSLDKISTSEIARSDSSAVTVDKSKVKIVEKADTTIRTKGQIVKQDTYLNMDSLVTGMTAVKHDLLDVKLTLNPKTGILSVEANVKPRDLPVKFDKTTTIETDITKSGKVVKSLEDKWSEEHSTSGVTKEPANTFWYWAIVIGIVVILAVFAYKRFKA